jgi:hypothetical protein
MMLLHSRAIHAAEQRASFTIEDAQESLYSNAIAQTPFNPILQVSRPMV